MITPDGWLDWAERRPGPSWKVNGGVNDASIVVPHSAVGMFPGWWGRLWGPDRASVQLWNGYDGHLIQHYPLTAQCWGSGSGFLNNHGIAIEQEGGFNAPRYDEPLRQAQIDTLVRVIREIGEFKNRPAGYWQRRISLFEHNETTMFGGSATACPSGRIPWGVIVPLVNAQSGDDDTMIRYVKSANPPFFSGLAVNGTQLVWTDSPVADDLHVSREAKSIELCVYLRDGELDLLDGDGQKAGFCHGRTSTYRVYPANDANRSIKLQGRGTIERLEVLGWYRS